MKTPKQIKQEAEASFERGKNYHEKKEYDMAYFKKGIAYVKLKNHKKAIKKFSNAIKYGSDEFKKNTFIFYLRGQEYTEIADYKKSIRLNPAHIKSLLMRGNAYFGACERNKAKADFDEYLRRKKVLKNEV
jgi:tetratricopeptide (TPR) repeat protein